MNSDMFTAYNAGSFGNFTNYADDDLLLPSSMSPAFQEDDYETAEAVDKSITAARQPGGGGLHGGDSEIIANTSSPISPQLLPATVSSSAHPVPSTSYPPSAGPPVYSPTIPPPSSYPIPHQTGNRYPPPRHNNLPPQHHRRPQTITASKEMAEGFNADYHPDETDTTTSVAMLTPHERRHLQQLLENQQRRDRKKKPSYWESVWGKRREIVKLVMLAFVVLLALSIHAAAVHYITAYIENTDVSTLAESALRIGYPVLVFVVLWILKVYVSQRYNGNNDE